MILEIKVLFRPSNVEVKPQQNDKFYLLICLAYVQSTRTRSQPSTYRLLARHRFCNCLRSKSRNRCLILLEAMRSNAKAPADFCLVSPTSLPLHGRRARNLSRPCNQGWNINQSWPHGLWPPGGSGSTHSALSNRETQKPISNSCGNFFSEVKTLFVAHNWVHSGSSPSLNITGNLEMLIYSLEWIV